MKTKRCVAAALFMMTFGQIVHSNMSKTIGNGSPSASTYKDLVGDVLYTYLVYVRRKDFGAAKKLIAE